jgi:hypothetical protein
MDDVLSIGSLWSSLVVEVFLRVLFITYSDGSKTKNPKTMEHVQTP